jgi:hypothetical protein
MNEGNGTEAAQFLFWEYINWIFGTVYPLLRFRRDSIAAEVAVAHICSSDFILCPLQAEILTERLGELARKHMMMGTVGDQARSQIPSLRFCHRFFGSHMPNNELSKIHFVSKFIRAFFLAEESVGT